MRALACVLGVVVGCAGDGGAPGAVVLESSGRSLIFDARGASLVVGLEALAFDTRAVTRGEVRIDLAPAGAVAGEGRARRDRGHGVTETWEVVPGGFEHTISLTERPAGGGPIHVAVDVDGGRPVMAHEGEVRLLDADGGLVATYGELSVIDATGRELEAHLVVRDGIGIEIDDTGAAYPLLVDPLLVAVEDGRIVPDTTSRYGPVSIATDVRYVALGGPLDGSPSTGRARLFSRGAVTWGPLTTLDPTAGAAGDEFATSVAISQDGAFVIAGAPLDDVGASTNVGTARVFGRPSGAWAQVATLIVAGAAADDVAGQSVAISADGSRAVVGVVRDESAGGIVDVGSARVFLRGATMSTWTEEAAVYPSSVTSARCGFAVDLSEDGSRMIVGCLLDRTTTGTEAGSATIYARTGTTWALERQLIPPAPAAAGDRAGTSVALSGDGAWAAVGIPLADTGGTDAGRVVVYRRSGSTWSMDASITPPDPAAGDAFGRAVALDRDGSHLFIGVPRDDTSAGADAGSARLYVRDAAGVWTEDVRFFATDAAPAMQLGTSIDLMMDASYGIVGSETNGARIVAFSSASANGTSCTSGSTCLSGFCVDGVCCDTRCDRGCEACVAARTGGSSGTCAPLTAAVASTVTCRPASGGCDLPETCAAGLPTCPADALAPSGNVCRLAAGGCDVAETCTGSSPLCPGDVLVTSGTVCRPAAGLCDQAEVCDGVSVACPGDAFSAAGTECGGGVEGSCVGEGTCNGTDATCRGGAMLPEGTVCLPSDTANPCDVDDTCDATGTCVPRFAASSTACGNAASEGPCDAADHCTGTSAECDSAFLVDVECRASGGACDPGERCSGASADCPPDDLLPAGAVCRASGGACDPAESCDGTGADCPADETTCSADTGGPLDAGIDAGAAVTPVEGCACRVGGSSGGVTWIALAFTLAAWVARRSTSRR